MYDEIRAFDAMIARLRDEFPSLIDLSTGRVLRLLDAMGRPQDHLPPVIHVAGTNGKGSTTAYLRAIAEAAGLKVHVLTSPHLVRFAERIRIAGELIGEAQLRELIDSSVAINAGGEISFNEIMSAMTLKAFAETPADLCVIEVGLGGRFDCTNVFDAPAVCIITPVDYDHLEMLGPELTKIAWEKAGIIKQGRPVIVARQMEEGFEVIEREAQSLNAPMLAMGRDIDAWEENGRMLVQTPDRLLDLPMPALYGPHQVGNAALAVMAMLTWGDPRIDEAALAKGVAGAVWPARFQRLTVGPLGAAAVARGADLWLDGAHNPHGGRALADTVDRLARDGRPVTLVVAQYARKDSVGFFEPLKRLGARVIATTFESTTALSPEDLAAAAATAGLVAETAPDVTTATTMALEVEGPAPHVIICGGLHFAGEVLALSPETWPT
ncbi:bifunctional folylpolyglutamate synthase/dihydrofolate synthase [Phenylobacterium sp. 20VBR1]|uniref:Dihydrofolate synthase/folylpolyglutamate synthase n=1 Tax=Phenylobacterium glaciei TaxID=2803784 RepID=A0A941D4V7_9CAUL|nr:folylpolyglutamate synthase/dihydrofolate synthase family protein [Phenylobacterium glaciei]MBR7621744.1 bifunctional folylpolyglutamate synthase/dihydrofolate synthase [Phenylobacterium glaciei]